MSSCSARFCEKSSAGILEDVDQVGQPLDLRLPFAELVRIVEVGEVAAGEPVLASISGAMTCVLILSPMSLLPLSATMSLKLAPFGIVIGGAKLVVRVLVGDVLDEQHEQDVVLVLAGIHAAAQLVARRPDGGVEVGFLDGHLSYPARFYETDYSVSVAPRSSFSLKSMDSIRSSLRSRWTS